jgi:hypothetical protein
MTGLAVTLPMIFLAAIGPSIVEIDDIRFRVTIVYDNLSPRGHGDAQVSLIRAARKHCKGKGEAISNGALELNDAEPLRSGKEAVALSEVYSCRPKD